MGSNLNANDCATVSPTATTTYTLTATNATGQIQANATVNVGQVRITVLHRGPGDLDGGRATRSTLAWTTQNATSVVLIGSELASQNAAGQRHAHGPPDHQLDLHLDRLRTWRPDSKRHHQCVRQVTQQPSSSKPKGGPQGPPFFVRSGVDLPAETQRRRETRRERPGTAKAAQAKGKPDAPFPTFDLRKVTASDLTTLRGLFLHPAIDGALHEHVLIHQQWQAYLHVARESGIPRTAAVRSNWRRKKSVIQSRNTFFLAILFVEDGVLLVEVAEGLRQLERVARDVRGLAGGERAGQGRIGLRGRQQNLPELLGLRVGAPWLPG